MKSAFGVDHDSEISKARFKLVRIPKNKLGPVAATGPQKVKDALNRAGDAPITIKGIGRATGRGISGTGAFIQGHPGMVGTGLVGGGAAAGYRSTRKKKS